MNKMETNKLGRNTEQGSSIRDQFLQALAEHGVAEEEIGDVNAYVHHVVTETKSGPQEVMVGAMKNPDQFIEWCRDWKKENSWPCKLLVMAAKIMLKAMNSNRPWMTYATSCLH